MGIVRTSARLLLDEAHRRPFSGAVLEWARMAVFFRHDELASWARKHDVVLDPDAPQSLSHDPRLAAQGCMADTAFFRAMGFDEVVSVDVSVYEGVDLVHDLNQPLPESMHGRFDAVFEGGTIQHIFDQRQVFENIHLALKVGGRIIHGMSPSNNHVDLGFYMFSPTLFADAYSAFGYTIEAFYLFDVLPFWYQGRYYSRPARVYRYEPGCLDALSYGRWGSRQTNIFVIATKTEDATTDRTPQQGQYRQMWQERADQDLVTESTPNEAIGSARASGPILWWKHIRERAVRALPKKMPPTVARY